MWHPFGTSILLIGTLIALLGVLLAAARRRYGRDADGVLDAVDALLPQTQCGQCGYPGCRPYARAIVAGESIDLCPPGGSVTQQRLSKLLGTQARIVLADSRPVVARIDEHRCIGCYLCIEACPVDAIVGAPQLMHTVIENRCTGCELCLPPCPMDCITLEPLPQPVPVEMPHSGEACIRCNRCEAVCPEGLAPQSLWWAARAGVDEATRHGLDACIECGLCNPACPSGINLVGTFSAVKQQAAAQKLAEQAAVRALSHYEQRQQRESDEAQATAEKRSRRISARARKW